MPLPPNLQSRKQTRDQHTAAALLSATSNSCCCYCQQAHSSDACRVVTQVDAWKQVLRRSGRCFVCLKKGHIGKECRSKFKCSKCGGKHHFSIWSRVSSEGEAHPTSAQASNKPPVKSVSSQSHSQTPSFNLDAATFVVPHTTSMYVDASKTVLLQPAQVLV